MLKNFYTKKKYDNIIIFNVLEHISEIELAIKNLNLLLVPKGQIIGSTPFIYRIHGAPDDYNRFTKTQLQKILKKGNFRNIKIRELGFGPFLACLSLLRGVIKYIPGVYQLLMILVILLDEFLIFMMKTNPKKIYPIGYIFTANKK